MTSGGSFNEATRSMTKQERADAQSRRERESEQRRQGAMTWIREQAPWLPEGWVGVYAGFAMRLKHRNGRTPAIDEITEHLRTRTFFAKTLDDPKHGIKPTREVASA